MPNFLITTVKVLCKSAALCLNWVDVNSFFQPLASSPDGPAPHLVLSVAFLTLSGSIDANLIWCTSSGLSGNNTSGSALCLGGFFVLNVVKFSWLEEEYHFWCYPSVVCLRYGRYLFSFCEWVSSMFCWWLILCWWSLDISGLSHLLLTFFSSSPDSQSSILLSNVLR